MKKDVLIIIPARSKSKRIKNKNIKNFMGQPMIYYSINNAIKSKIASKIHISTESIKIKKKIEKEKSLKIDFLRPNKLSNDKTPIIEVVRFVNNQYILNGFKYKYIVLLSACAPLLDKQDLINGINLAKKNKTSYPILSVSKYPSPIEWALKKNNNTIQFSTKDYVKNSQSFKEKYYDTGSIAIFKASSLANISKNKFFKRFIPLILPKYKAVDIDNIEDWEMAKILYRGLKK